MAARTSHIVTNVAVATSPALCVSFSMRKKHPFAKILQGADDIAKKGAVREKGRGAATKSHCSRGTLHQN